MGSRGFTLQPGEEVAIKKPGFVLKRGYDKFVSGKRVLIVEDILTTGGTVMEIIKTTRAVGGIVQGVGALCNRGGITKEYLDVPKLHCLVDLPLETWTKEECMRTGPCSEGIPVNTQVGKGAAFLARQQATR